MSFLIVIFLVLGIFAFLSFLFDSTAKDLNKVNESIERGNKKMEAWLKKRQKT